MNTGRYKLNYFSGAVFWLISRHGAMASAADRQLEGCGFESRRRHLFSLDIFFKHGLVLLLIII